MVFLPCKTNSKLMKNIFLIASFLLTTITLVAQNREIKFETSSFEEVKAKAKKENKLIFVDAYTTWCGPCKWMAKSVFTNDTVADYFNANFIATKIDMEKGEGIEFRKKYQVFCFPNLLFINGDGEIIHRRGGGMPPANFIAFAKEAQGTTNTYQAFAKEYETKKTDAQFLTTYLSYLGKTCMPVDDIVNAYFETQNEANFTSRSNWNLFYTHDKSHKSKMFHYVLNNLATYNNLYTQDSVNRKLQDVLYASGKKLIATKTINEEGFANFKAELKTMPESVSNNVSFHLNLDYASRKEDWKSYGDLLLSQGDTYLTSKEFNSYAWTIYEKVSDEAVIKKASQWMKKFIDENQNNPKASLYAEYDTYASILYKLKMKNEALSAANEAVKRGKASNQDIADTEKLIENIKKL